MIVRLKARLQDSIIEMELMEETLTAMKEALEYSTSAEGCLPPDASIEESLLKLMKEEAKLNKSNTDDIAWSKEETKDLCDYVAESMRNHIHKVNGKPGLYRFSPKTTGMAMCQLIRSGKSSYEQLREDNIIILPLSKVLSRKKQLQKITVGDCVVMYEQQLLIRKFVTEIGELICDEMKLKEDIVINVTTNKMVGFSEDFICQKKILQNLLDEDEVKNFCEPAKSVNQWRFRSINGRQCNVEFWYNAGSLDGNALLEQFN